MKSLDQLSNPLLFIALIICCISCNKFDRKYTDVNSEYSASDNSAAGRIRDPNVKPNIIIIMADDIGYEVPTYSGGESYSTPNLDYLATIGTQFTQAHAAPLCSPSRFMLMTGKYNFRNYSRW